MSELESLPRGHSADGNLIDEPTLARILGVDPGAIRRGVRAGNIHAIKDPGRGNLFDLEDVRRRLAAAGWDGREPLLTAQQAAGRLGVDHAELARLVRDGHLNPVRPLPGMASRYLSSEVELVVDGGRARAIVAEAGSVMRLLASNLVLVVAIVIAIFPLIALVRGTAALAGVDHPHTFLDWVGFAFSAVALLAGGIFFCYSVRYYLATFIVLASAAPWLLKFRNERREGRIVARERDPSHLVLGYQPFVSIHIAAYNEERVIARLLEACEKLDYPNFEVILVDDSTDGTAEIAAHWATHPRFKVIHRTDRSGFKGGALRVALDNMDSRAEYVAVFDADAVPFPDSIERLLPHFYEMQDGRAHRKHHVAAVQSYQWHVLNKGQSWLTEAVRAEYSGSYMIERPFQQALGGMKMVAGTAYMIRTDILRKVGWGTSITEDWELTLHLYTLGYKVAYTPFAETPAECVSGVRRLARQRMRWAEGHSFNVKKWFPIIFTSPLVSAVEKVEFAFYVTYYLQAVLLLVGTFSWIVAELGLHARIPGWTAVLGWSLVIANLAALPLMNAAGLVLEEAPPGDFRGAITSIITAYLLIPYQGWAAIKGMFEDAEGTWIRTPKTGRLTGAIHHLRPVAMIQQWAVGLPRREAPAGVATKAVASPHGRVVPRLVTFALVIFTAGVTFGAVVLPVTAAETNYYLHTNRAMNHAPGHLSEPTAITLSTGEPVTFTSTDSYPAGFVVPAGKYTFTAEWRTGTASRASFTFTVGFGTQCRAFTTLVSWSPTFAVPDGPETTNATTIHATDLPRGGPYHVCLRIELNHLQCKSGEDEGGDTGKTAQSSGATTTNGGDDQDGGEDEGDNDTTCSIRMAFDSGHNQAILTLPPIEVAEKSLPLAGVALFIPFLAAVVARRRRPTWSR